MRARHDPIPNFVPVIPAKVKVTTGEEEEDTLYCGRAKLFHFIDKQWKERGVGDVKLLRNKTGKVRLLMRRDQILKICANHMLRPDMELSPVVNNNKAWFWVANDFANEEVKLEKLCIRFKTSDESMAFKEAFDQARHSLSAISLGKPPKNGKRASITFSSNKDSSKIQKSQLMQQAKTGSSVEVFLDKSKFDTTTLGEFSFSSEPIIQEVKDMEVGESKKTEEPPKVNSFSGFSFIESTGTLETKTTTDVSTPSANFVFGISTSLMNNSQSSVLTNTTANAYNVVSSCQQKLAKGSNPSEVAKELEKKSLMSKSKAQSVVEAKPLSELFKLLTDSWECSDCYTRNNAMDTKCVACQAPSPLMANNKSSSVITSSKYIESSNKPPLSELFNSGANCVYCVVCGNFKDPSQPPKPQQANIFQLNTSSSSAMPMTTFSFGIFKDTVSKESTTFNFRMPQAEDKSVSSKLKETTGIKGFVFCTPVKSSVALDANDSSFTFGSPAKSFDFNFTAKSPATLPGGGGETSKDEMVESENVYFSPIVPLPDKIEMKTGEENEEILYSYRAKLFRFDNAVEEWKERGLGDIKLLRHRETGKLRLIMRRDHVLKLCLNHIVSNDLEFTPKDEKSWFWSTADYSEDEIEYMQFACRFKTAEIAADFMKAIDNARKNVKLAIKISTKTTTSLVKEIEIVYEAKATPEEKVAALKLQLPEDFYAYKQKDCCSCRGCREPSIVLDPDVTGQDSSKSKPKLISKKKKVTAQSKISSTVDTSLSSSYESTCENTIQSVTQSAQSVKHEFSFATATSLPDKIEVKTGEEDEEILYSYRAKLFRFDNAVKEWKERGLGDIKLLRHRETGKLRLIMRRDHVLKLYLNHIVSNDLEFTPKDEKSWFWSIADYSEDEIEYMQFACRFKTAEIAADFMKAIDNARKNVKLAMKIPTKTTTSPVKEIEIVYEAKATPEEKVAALKLQLPEDFYAYKQKDCCSCRGCREPSIVLDPDVTGQDSSKSKPKLVSKKKKVTAQSKISSTVDTSLSSSHESTSENTIQSVTQSAQSVKHEFSFATATSLPDKIEVKTGEEDEEILYSYRAKLFRFDNAVKEWKERGLGDIKLLRHRETGKLRLIMRRDHVLKLCLNHIVSNDLEFTPKDEKSWFWSTADYSEDEIEYMQFACRFKTAEIAADFMKAIDNARKNVKLAMKIPTKTTTSPVKEIEIVYEAKATPEEKVAALKLQLPEDFYAYKQKDCCSCRGCREPSIVLDPDVTGQDSSKSKPKLVSKKKKVTAQSKISSTVDTSLSSSHESTSENTIQSVTQSAQSVKHEFSFATATSLPDKIEVKTGEEDEEILYSYRAKLFRFDNAVKEWKERGLGDIKLLRHRETGKLRLIMRRDHVLKLCLNHIVSNDLEFTPKDEKSWFWSTADYSEDEIEYMQFACRFKTAEIAADFMKAIDNARKNVKLAMKIPTKTTTSPVKEIEIVYEAKATPEEKVAALKLQLPENFYAYKQKDCCSCRGCREPSIVLDPDVTGQDSSKVGCCCCAASRCCLQLPNHPQREVPSAFR